MNEPYYSENQANFVIVMQNFAIVNMETSPLSALMTHLLPAEILLRVRIKQFSSPWIIFSQQTTVSRTQETDVTAQLMMGVRLLQVQAHMCVQMFILTLIGLIYTSRNGKDLHLCHTSPFKKFMVVYQR